jgi:hypothetical protein
MFKTAKLILNDVISYVSSNLFLLMFNEFDFSLVVVTPSKVSRKYDIFPPHNNNNINNILPICQHALLELNNDGHPYN